MKIFGNVNAWAALVLSLFVWACVSENPGLDDPGSDQAGADQSLDSRYQAALEEHVSMNRANWSGLQKHGVPDSSELRLDYFYFAKSEENARALESVLAQKPGLSVQIEWIEDESLWEVHGTTQPMQVSLELLNEWVGPMIKMGLETGCDFDGWGAQAPENEDAPPIDPTL